MKLVELRGTSGVERLVLDGSGVPIMGSPEWTEIYSVQVVGERPPMSLDFDAPMLHFLNFGTGQFSTDTMICLTTMWTKGHSRRASSSRSIKTRPSG